MFDIFFLFKFRLKHRPYKMHMKKNTREKIPPLRTNTLWGYWFRAFVDDCVGKRFEKKENWEKRPRLSGEFATRSRWLKHNTHFCRLAHKTHNGSHICRYYRPSKRSVKFQLAEIFFTNEKKKYECAYKILTGSSDKHVWRAVDSNEAYPLSPLPFLLPFYQSYRTVIFTTVFRSDMTAR